MMVGFLKQLKTKLVVLVLQYSGQTRIIIALLTDGTDKTAGKVSIPFGGDS
jgi:hypothetical protein